MEVIVEYDIVLIVCRILKGLCMKVLGCVLNRVLDVKMVMMVIFIDRGNEIVLNFIFLE